MATIPTDQAQVQPDALPTVRFNPDAPIEAFGGGRAATSFGAIEQVGQSAMDLGRTYKMHADQVATMTADNGMAQAENKIQTQVSQMRGQDALKAPDFVKEQWQQAQDAAMKGAANDAQKQAILRSSLLRQSTLDRTVQMHVANETHAMAEQTTVDSIDNSRDAAVMNAFDGDRVGLEKDRQTAAMQDWAGRNGVPLDSPIYQKRLTDTLSQTNKEVIQNMVDNAQEKTAQEYFQANKGQMNARDIDFVSKITERAETLQKGLDMWNKVGGLKLPDGTPDEAAMERHVMADPSITSIDQKIKALDFVKARASEERVNQARADQANDKAFINQTLQGRTQGVPLADAMRAAQDAGKTPYDQNAYEEQVKKIYAPPSESDPATHNQIWEGIEGGTITNKQQIDQAAASGALNQKDWFEERKHLYNTIQNGSDPETKQTWERIKLQAEQTFGSDKLKKDAFLYEMHSISDGKSNEDLWKTANDKLKTDPSTQWSIFGAHFGGSPQYESDNSKRDATNLAWGKIHQDIGEDQANAIGGGALYQGKKNWGLADVNSFADSLGGWDKIKVGTPANNAIQSLMGKKQPVTPANVNAVLQKYPDGHF